MKKILSITATIAGIAYLASGIGLLAFQGVLKMVMSYESDMTNVYPVQNVMELVLLGIPCVVLGILSMSEYSEHRRGEFTTRYIQQRDVGVGWGINHYRQFPQ